MTMKAHTKETQATLTPAKALSFLKEGNKRFQNNLKVHRNLLEQVNETSEGQWPFATILSCIDSRVSAELVFDQGLGDVFSVRIAGNFVNRDILGSMEFACRIAGTKLVVVLGHTNCGAIKGACDGEELGNLKAMLDNIKPAVDAVKSPEEAKLRTSTNLAFVDEVAKVNVELTIERIRHESPTLAQMEKDGVIEIIGAMYDITTGAVDFFE